jgi:hypothetical protein
MRNLADYIPIQRFEQIFLLFLILGILSACSSGKKQTKSGSSLEVITTNVGSDGVPVKIEFRKGSSHNHPLMAIWLEDIDGNYLETLYVAASIGTGIFGHGKVNKGVWESGPLSRPAALPYWWHKYGYLPEPETKVPDAITGPTPQNDFMLDSRITTSSGPIVNVLFEINQSWDWNEYWTNDKFPGDADYMSSSQPAVVYMVTIDLEKTDTIYTMQVAGHSHYSGKDGKLYDDISSLTTALDIAGVIKVNTGNK